MRSIDVRRSLWILALLAASALPRAAVATEPAPAEIAGTDFPPGIHIEVPVRLSVAKVVFSIDEPDFSGSEPTVFVWMNQMLDWLEKWHTRRSVIAVMHGDPSFWALNDAAWDRLNQGTTGNPYRATIEELSRRGVRFEICAFAMQQHGFVNADLLPEVAVTTGALLRFLQLEQKGYSLLQP